MKSEILKLKDNSQKYNKENNNDIYVLKTVKQKNYRFII